MVESRHQVMKCPRGRVIKAIESFIRNGEISLHGLEVGLLWSLTPFLKSHSCVLIIPESPIIDISVVKAEAKTVVIGVEKESEFVGIEFLDCDLFDGHVVTARYHKPMVTVSRDIDHLVIREKVGVVIQV